jgi:hypothetical protein
LVCSLRVYIGGQEVVEREQGQGFDGDDVGGDIELGVLVAEAVAERGADEVFLAERSCAGRAGGGNQEPVDGGCALRVDRAGAVYGGDALLAGDAGVEIGAAGGVVGVAGDGYRGAGFVGDFDGIGNVLDRAGVGRVNASHLGVEGLALQRQLLLDFHFYSGTGSFLGAN